MTEKPKHTPGPWEVFHFPTGGSPLVQRGSEGGFKVVGTTREQANADARLIAAAPDLLAALEALICAFRTKGDAIDWVHNMKVAALNGQEIIKRAKGE